MSSPFPELHPRVRAFIEKACAGIPSTRRAQEVERELLSHVLEIDDELRSCYLNDEQIADEIIRRMGDALELERYITDANRTSAQKWFIRGFAVVSLLAFISVVLTGIYYYGRAVRTLNEDRDTNRTYFAEILANQNNLKLAKLAQPVSTGEDAGPFLNKILPSFEEMDRRGPRSAAFVVSKDQYDASTLHFQDVLNGKIKIDFGHLDFSWMKNLDKYSYWDIYENEAVPYLVGRGPGVDLLKIARVRLVQGVIAGNLPRALKEDYELARLLYSTNVLRYIDTGGAILHIILRNYEMARKAGRIGSLPWIDWTREDILSLRRTLRQTASLFTSVATSPSILDAYLENRNWDIGICAGLSERGLYSGIVESFFRKSWPFELNVDERMTKIDALVQMNEERCRLTTILKSSKMVEKEFQNSWDLPLMHLALNFPYLRRIYGVDNAHVFFPALNPK